MRIIILSCLFLISVQTFSQSDYFLKLGSKVDVNPFSYDNISVLPMIELTRELRSMEIGLALSIHKTSYRTFDANSYWYSFDNPIIYFQEEQQTATFLKIIVNKKWRISEFTNFTIGLNPLIGMSDINATFIPIHGKITEDVVPTIYSETLFAVGFTPEAGLQYTFPIGIKVGTTFTASMFFGIRESDYPSRWGRTDHENFTLGIIQSIAIPLNWFDY